MDEVSANTLYLYEMEELYGECAFYKRLVTQRKIPNHDSTNFVKTFSTGRNTIQSGEVILVVQNKHFVTFRRPLPRDIEIVDMFDANLNEFWDLVDKYSEKNGYGFIHANLQLLL